MAQAGRFPLIGAPADRAAAQAAFELGESLRLKGDFGRALESYSRAIALDQDLLDAYRQAAAVSKMLRERATAAGQRDVVEFARQRATAYLALLGGRLDEAGDAAGAEASYRGALELTPQDSVVLRSLGRVLFYGNHLAEAEALFQRAIALAPQAPEGHTGHGVVLEKLRRVDEAIAAFRRATALPGRTALAISQLARAREIACDWDGLAGDQERVMELVRRDEPALPLLILSFCDDPDLQLRCARRWAQDFMVAPGRRLPARPPEKRERLRVGYLSADYRVHAMTALLTELFERHDRARFEIFGYSLGPDDGSATRRRVETAFDHFVDLQALSDEAAARRIHADGIDVLIDLNGYTLGARSRILAFRPAPVQVQYLGYPGTTGADFIDYVLADPVVITPDLYRCYSEKIVALPNSYQPNDTRRPIATAPPGREAAGLPEDAFVFCCFNSPYKITAAMFGAWMRLLQAIPHGVLWLLQANASLVVNLRREAAARGVDPARLVFAPEVKAPEHLARHRLADLFLDTLPYNAHTTAADALFMGVPLVTLSGRTFAARVAASLLRAVSLPELITTSYAEYEALAARLAREPDRLAAIRERLSRARAAQPLFDTPRLARDIEHALTEMQRLALAGETPRGFSVAGLAGYRAPGEGPGRDR